MAEMSPELIERMVAFVERAASSWSTMGDGRSYDSEIKEMWAEIRREREPYRVDAERIASTHHGQPITDAVLAGINFGLAITNKDLALGECKRMFGRAVDAARGGSVLAREHIKSVTNND